MEAKDVLELISAFDASALTELEMEKEGFHLRLLRDIQRQPLGEAAGTVQDRKSEQLACTDKKGCGREPYVQEVFSKEDGKISEGRDTRAFGHEKSGSAACGKDEISGCRDSGNLRQVKAPLVGVFYAAPSPEAAPYVTEGQRVEAGQVLCLIEAMKMMNELKSPVSGVIRKICGRNGQLAEYDQVLFEVEKC